MNNLEEMDKLLETYSLIFQYWEPVRNKNNSPITNNEINQ